MVFRFGFTLGSVEAVVAGRALGVDVRVFPLRISHTTVDPLRFARLAIRVHDDLEGRGLSTRGEPSAGRRARTGWGSPSSRTRTWCPAWPARCPRPAPRPAAR
ncbi:MULTISPECIES: hypothetical protein [Amycolatopsis]|uniref:hypothetical protein n=1 Tax=Amycolatopsis TaxID=1813 RepID=UPI0023DDB729|nr:MULTISPECIES: hypothetical protein [Amycolatopsis]